MVIKIIEFSKSADRNAIYLTCFNTSYKQRETE